MMQKSLKKQKLPYLITTENETIISKNDNDIGQTDLIKMHTATRPHAAPTAA